MKFILKTLKHLWSAPTYTLKVILALTWGTFKVFAFFIKQRLFGMDLPNHAIVKPDCLYRGGQPSAKGMKMLMRKGIKTIVVLRTDFDPEWIQTNSNGKIVPVHIPFNPYRPNKRIVKKFLLIMKDLQMHPVYIHCFHGADRTGMFVAFYRIIFQGWSKKAAIEEMKQFGSHWWHSSLIQYIKKFDVEEMKQELKINN